MATTHYGFSTIQTSQMNWDKDVNVNFGDLDFLLSSSMKQLPWVPDIRQANIANLSPYAFGRARQGVYGLEIFEETDNLIPYADCFRTSDWTLTGSAAVSDFDLFMGIKKVSFSDASSAAEVDFTTGTGTEYTVSFEGNSTLEIYDGATLVETISSSPTTVTLTASTSYTLKISGDDTWAAQVQIEPKGFATPFSLKENKRYDCNLVWDLEKSQKVTINVLCIPGVDTASSWGRVIYTDAFEVYFANDFSSLNLKVGTETTQYLFNFQQGKNYLISAVTTNDRVRVYLDQVLVMEIESDVSISKFGFYNGVCDCFILGLAIDRFMGVENVAAPPLWVLPEICPIPVETAASFNATQKDRVILMDSTAAPITVNLMPNIQRPGHVITVKDSGGNAGTNNITLAPSGSAEIDGAANAVINTDYGKITIIFDGDNWFTI